MYTSLLAKKTFTTALNNGAEHCLLSAAPLKRLVVRVGVPSTLFRKLSPELQAGDKVKLRLVP